MNLRYDKYICYKIQNTINGYGTLDNNLVVFATSFIVKYNTSVKSGSARWVIVWSIQELKLSIKHLETLSRSS